MTSTDSHRWNSVLGLYVALALGAASTLPFVRVAPNRLLSGEPVYLWDIFQSQSNQLVLVLFLAVFALLFIAIGQAQRRFIQLMVSFAMAASSNVPRAKTAVRKVSSVASGCGWCMMPSTITKLTS